MGRGTSTGLTIRDYYKKRGQNTHGEGAKRRRLSKESEKRRKELKRRQRELREKANPANG